MPTPHWSRSTHCERRGPAVRDVAVVSFAQSPAGATPVAETEAQMLFPVVAEAVERSGLPRDEIGFTCSGSSGSRSNGLSIR